MLGVVRNNIQAFLVSALVSSPAYAEPPNPCHLPGGFEFAKTKPTLLEYECDDDSVCGVSLESPTEIQNRSFLQFVLYFDRGNRGQINLADQRDLNSGVVRTIFYLHSELLKVVSVDAVYERKDGCLLVSSWYAA